MNNLNVLDFSNNQRDSAVDRLTRERLSCLLEQERKNPEFQKNPKLKKKHIYTIKRKDVDGNMIEEGIMLNQSLILRTTQEGEMRLQIGESEELGEGGFGKVKLATRYLRFLPNDKMDVKTVTQVVKAVKLQRVVNETDDSWQQRVATEKASLEAEQQFTSAKYPHTKALVIRHFSKKDKKSGVLTEMVKFYLYMPNLGEALDEVLGEDSPRYTDDVALGFMSELSADLARVHALGIVHRDLKLENILVDAGQHPSIADFGESMWIDKPNLEERGTPLYRPPEVIYGNGWSMPGDIYSLAGVAGEVFGEEDIFQYKLSVPGRKLTNADLLKPYHFADFLNIKDSETQKRVLSFLKLMSHDDSKRRPSASVCQYFFDYMRARPSPRTLLIDLLNDSLDEIQRHRQQDKLQELINIFTNPNLTAKLEALKFTLSTELWKKLQNDLANPKSPLQKLLQARPAPAAASPSMPEVPLALENEDDILVRARDGIRYYLQRSRVHVSGPQKFFGRLFGQPPELGKVRAEMYKDLLTNRDLSRPEKLMVLLALLETHSGTQLKADVIAMIDPKEFSNETVIMKSKNSILSNIKKEICEKTPSVMQVSQLTAIMTDVIEIVEKGKNPLEDPKLHLRERLQAVIAEPAEAGSRLRRSKPGSSS